MQSLRPENDNSIPFDTIGKEPTMGTNIKQGNTVNQLAKAAAEGNLPLVDALLKDFSEKNCRGDKSKDREKMMSFLVMDSSFKYRNRTVMEWAIVEGQEKVIALLLKYCLTSKLEFAPTQPGTSKRRSKQIRLQSIKHRQLKIRKNFNVNAEKIRAGRRGVDSPLHWACYFGKVRIVCLLLDYGFNHMDLDTVGNTPMHLAAAGSGAKESTSKGGSQHLLVIQLLLSEAAKTDSVENYLCIRNIFGNTALQLSSADEKVKVFLRQVTRKQVSAVDYLSREKIEITGKELEHELALVFSKSKNSSVDRKDIEKLGQKIESAELAVCDETMIEKAKGVISKLEQQLKLEEEIKIFQNHTRASVYGVRPRFSVKTLQNEMMQSHKNGLSKVIVRKAALVKVSYETEMTLLSKLAIVLGMLPGLKITREMIQLDVAIRESLKIGLKKTHPLLKLAILLFKRLTIEDNFMKTLEDDQYNKGVTGKQLVQAIKKQSEEVEKIAGIVSKYNDYVYQNMESLNNTAHEVLDKTKQETNGFSSLIDVLIIPKSCTLMEDRIKALTKEQKQARRRENENKSKDQNGNKAGKSRGKGKKGKKRK